MESGYSGDTKPKCIRHIIISGGGPKGIISYGALRRLHEKKIWSHDELKTVHGISIATVVSLFILLRYEWDVIDAFISKRPWQDLLSIPPDMLFSSFSKKGIFGEKFFVDVIGSLLLAKDIPLDVTMEG